MEAATLHASRYVTVRHQFGKPIGALQSIQHRLARAYVLSQGTKWLARRAAWDTADPVAAAAAACYGAEAIREVISTTHQVCGAIGITDEFGLTAYTARLAMLQTELGGAIAHARALARARWSERVNGAKAGRAGLPEPWQARPGRRRRQSGRSMRASASGPSRPSPTAARCVVQYFSAPLASRDSSSLSNLSSACTDRRF